jgi:hypothetical protein
VRGNRHDRSGRNDKPLGLGAPVDPPRRADGHHQITDRQAGLPRADQLDLSSGVHPGNPRGWQLSAAVPAQPDISGIDRGEVDADANFVATRLTIGTLDHGQDLGPSGLWDCDGD